MVTKPPPKKKATAPRSSGATITGKEKVGTSDAGAEMTSADLAASYQWSLALLNSDPDLRRLFNQAVKGGWEAERFAAELQDTAWFKKHSDTWRVNETQRLTDPASFKANQKEKVAELQDLARGMGAVLSDRELKLISNNALMLGWNTPQVRDSLARYVKQMNAGDLKGQRIGESGEHFRTLTKVAERNGYKIPKGRIDGWLSSIASGNSTVEDYSELIRRRTAAAYPGLADELLAGTDLEDLAAPYRDQMARLLEIPANQIDFSDKAIQKALNKPDAKGRPGAMPLYEFQDQVRADARWQYTDNARDEVMGQVMRIGRNFGRTG